ncbi:hypothetical protein EVAR_61868_1 [Eumeta japonica]|uniref:Uncharacterized protein n=1 Tax=Eumeta variegata TaxID=151549 RepID=A0A4C1ZLF2_EUMVA|nr:hypothetical protein EVAR_61868_1 [Eumeta japonica]
MKVCEKCASLPSLWVSTHKRTGDFYLSSWQRGESPVPMFVVRLVLAAAGAGTLAWSVAEGPTRFWPIYLTNWGLVLLAFTSLSALLVSFMALCTRKTGEGIAQKRVNCYVYM